MPNKITYRKGDIQDYITSIVYYMYNSKMDLCWHFGNQSFYNKKAFREAQLNTQSVTLVTIEKAMQKSFTIFFVFLIMISLAFR